MSAGYIGVQRLRLVAEHGAGAHGLRARVEDALRISSKPPGLAHRFLLIRRLRLRLPREASAQSLALRLEQEWRRLEALAQPMATASADAEAVWAVDEVAARGVLLRRWLDGEPAVAWFWQRLLPAVEFAASLAQRIVGLLFEPLAAAAHSPSFERAVQQRLWREAWPQIVAAGQARAVMAASSPRQEQVFQQVLREPDGVLESLSLRSWVVPDAARLAASLPDAQQQAIVSALPRPRHSAQEHAEVPRWLPDATREHRPAAQAFLANRVASRAHMPVASPSGPAKQAIGCTTAHLAAATVDGATTDWAGLWFLLPLLQQLGLAQQPAPARLLAALLRRAAMRHDLDAPALAWRAQLGDFDDVRADDWWRRARWACVRQARLPLRRLLHRPGRVWLSPQRIDLWLPLARAHIRIRRAGFDIDPGYVPWLDCVIRFHYA